MVLFDDLAISGNFVINLKPFFLQLLDVLIRKRLD
jgi:hypothetical protein